MSSTLLRVVRVTALALFVSALTVGCRQDMHDQPRFEPLEASSFFADGRASRPQVEGTVARGQLRLDEHFERGLVGGAPAETFPVVVTAELLERGRERYDIYCSICHDRTGSGQGMAVKRGVKAPPSLHEERLVTSSPGYLFDVMTNGFGAMMDYSDRVTPADRWAIAAWIRVLQRAERGTLADVPTAERAALEEQRP